MTAGVRRRVVAALVLALLAGCGASESTAGPGTETPASPAAGSGRWSPVAAWPGPNWWVGLTVWTGREVLVLGSGNEPRPEELCCMEGYPLAPGAAAYDPRSGRWRTVPTAPFSLREASLAVLDGRVYGFASDFDRGYGKAASSALYMYPGSGGWRRAQGPARVRGLAVNGRIVAAGDRIVLEGRTTGDEPPAYQAYDPAARTWTPLPPLPWKGNNVTSDLIGLPDGRLVMVAASPYPPGTDPLAAEDRLPPQRWRGAVLDAGGRAWRILPPSPVTVGHGDRRGQWVAAGGLVVNLADGSLPRRDKLSYTPKGQARDAIRDQLPAPPTGGILDVDAGTWSLLPQRPHREHPLRVTEPVEWIDAAGGDIAVLDGLAYDTRRRTWTDLGPVPSAPDGLRNAVVVWAGDRLLAWANAKKIGTADGHGSRTALDNVGWSWTLAVP